MATNAPGEEGPDPREIFKVLVEDRESKTKLPDPQFYTHFPYGTDKLAFLRKHHEYFIVFEDDDGKACLVGARQSLLGVCQAYGQRNSYCNRPDCRELHLCRDHVGGYCRLGVDCRKDHHFQGDHNKTILRALNLTEFQDTSLLNLVRMSLPQICRWHNRTAGGCPNKTACTRFHICDQFVIGRCILVDDACRKGHNFESEHSQRLLKAYKLKDKSPDDLKSALLIHRIKGRTVEQNPAKITADLQRLLVAERQGGENDDNDLPFALGVEKSQTLFSAFKKPIADDSEAARALFQSDEMRMLLGALDEEELLQILEYQSEIEHQHEAEKAVNQANKDKDTNVNTEGATAAKPTVATPKNDNALLLYTGYAPQEDKTLLCKDALINSCPHDEQTCKNGHYISPYLWQIRVKEVWYNMDTVNEDVETSYKNKDEDYITNIPEEVPELSGKLIQVVFRRMTADILKEGNTRLNFDMLGDERYRVRRLSTDPLEARPRGLDDIFGRPRTLRGIKKRPVVAKPVHRGLDAEFRRFFAEKEKPKEQPPVPPPKSEHQWQVEIKGAWVDLENANDEIQEAFHDRAPDYTTMLPNDDGTEDIIDINFSEMRAIILGTTTRLAIRRISREDGRDTTPDVTRPGVTPTPGRLKKKRSAKVATRTDTPVVPTDTVTETDQTPTDDTSEGETVTPADATRIDTETEAKDESDQTRPERWIWQWSEDFETWTDYDQDVSEALELAHSAGKKSGKLLVDGVPCRVNFTEMTRTVESKTELLRRVPKE